MLQQQQQYTNSWPEFDFQAKEVLWRLSPEKDCNVISAAVVMYAISTSGV